MPAPESSLLPSTNLLQNLTSAERSSLIGIGTRIRLEKNSLIFRAGAPSEYVYVILNGRAKIYELSPQGKEVIMWFCFPGELFGLAEVWRGAHRVVYAQACCEVDLIRFERVKFRQHLLDHPMMAMQVIDILSGRLRVLGDMLLSLTSTDVTIRLVKLLARLFQRYGHVRDGRVYIDIPLTHQEMADMIGCCRQTVTSTLGVLRRDHGLRSEKRMFYMQFTTPEEATQALVRVGVELTGASI